MSIPLQHLTHTIDRLFADNKGLLAMDESSTTCNRRFSALGIPVSEKYRRAWRELIITTPGLNDAIGGVILHDETVYQSQTNGKTFLHTLADAGILFGVKVDQGLRPFALHADEQITEGLDGLPECLRHYAALGATFAKWRAVIHIYNGKPSAACILANAHALARYAAMCQEAGLVPVVESEVLMDGAHTIAHCQEISEQVLRTVFQELNQQNVLLEGLILKPNMVLPGAAYPACVELQEVVQASISCLLRAVPAAVPVIAFLSGGQSGDLASSRLNAINLFRQDHSLPWKLTFSFARAIQYPALNIWRGVPDKVEDAQDALYRRALDNQLACRSQYVDTGIFADADVAVNQ